jgi:hypothetical protein
MVKKPNLCRGIPYKMRTVSPYTSSHRAQYGTAWPMGLPAKHRVFAVGSSWNSWSGLEQRSKSTHHGAGGFNGRAVQD